VYDFSSGTLVLRCPTCGRSVPSRDEDVALPALGAALPPTVMFGELIKNAPFDRANYRVMRDCASCGLDYMSLVRIGEDERVVFCCECGKIEYAEGAPKTEETKRE